MVHTEERAYNAGFVEHAKIVQPIFERLTEELRQANEQVAALQNQATGALRISGLKEQSDALSDDERSEIFAWYCSYCGSKDSRCQCWNDE